MPPFKYIEVAINISRYPKWVGTSGGGKESANNSALIAVESQQLKVKTMPKVLESDGS